jgi:hypothetical protein
MATKHGDAKRLGLPAVFEDLWRLRTGLLVLAKCPSHILGDRSVGRSDRRFSKTIGRNLRPLAPVSRSAALARDGVKQRG